MTALEDTEIIEIRHQLNIFLIDLHYSSITDDPVSSTCLAKKPLKLLTAIEKLEAIDNSLDGLELLNSSMMN